MKSDCEVQRMNERDSIKQSCLPPFVKGVHIHDQADIRLQQAEGGCKTAGRCELAKTLPWLQNPDQHPDSKPNQTHSKKKQKRDKIAAVAFYCGRQLEVMCSAFTCDTNRVEAIGRDPLQPQPES